MAVLKVLSEVICPKELFGVVAFPKFMHIHQMLDPDIPITFRGEHVLIPMHRSSAALELVTAVTAGVEHTV